MRKTGFVSHCLSNPLFLDGQLSLGGHWIMSDAILTFILVYLGMDA